jgi:Divergent InlB B-repeat domain
MKKFILSIIFCLVFAVNASAYTYYYIDSAAANDSANGTSTATPWKRCPGMVGWSGSHTPTAGDVFVFKGGDTWTSGYLPLTVQQSGTSGAGNTITYMGGQQCGYSPASPFVHCDGVNYPCGSNASLACNSGVAWGTGYPIFDGGMVDKGYGIFANAKSYYTIDGIKIQNFGNYPITAVWSANTAFSTGNIVYPTSAASTTAKTYEYSAGGNCTTGATEPVWVTTYPGSTSDGTCTWARLIDAAGSGAAWQHTSSGNYVEIKNCILQPEALEAFHYSSDGSTNANAIYLHDLAIRRAGRGVVYGNTSSNVTDLQVYNLDWQGPASLFTGAYHLDGLMIGNSSRTDCTNYPSSGIASMSFHHNRFYGDWSQQASALLFSNACSNNLTIYDNIFSFENQTGWAYPIISSGMVGISTSGSNIYIYNNTFSSDAIPGANGGKWGITIPSALTGTVLIENNIFSQLAIDVECDSSVCTGASMNYNLHYPSTVGGFGKAIITTGYNCTTLASCQSHSTEMNSPTFGDPKFTLYPNGTTGYANFALLSSSPAKDTGVSLATTFTTDYLWNTISTWGIGAYNYEADSGASTYPLSVTVAHGTVTSSPAGISCADNIGTCTYNFPSESVTLSQTPDSGYTFAGWSGTGVASGCSGTGTCVVTTSAAGSATASYTGTPYVVTVSMVNPGGTINHLGTNNVTSGNTLVLTATINNGWTLAWSGTCGGSGTTTYTTSAITADCTVIGTFTEIPILPWH